jgi:hypothetical protein
MNYTIEVIYLKLGIFLFFVLDFRVLIFLIVKIIIIIIIYIYDLCRSPIS